MASTYTNDLRLELIAVGEGSGSAPNDWGSKTNVNLTSIASSFGPGTESIGSDANVTMTMADGAADELRALYLKVTSSATLTATRTITIAPNTVAKLWIVENATTGSQSIALSQGSGANVTVANGAVKMVYTDGAGAGAAVTDALVDLDLTGTTTLATAAVTNLTLGGTAVTATGAEVNYLDITALGTSQASKAVTADANGVVKFDAAITEQSPTALTSGTTVALDVRDGSVFTITLAHNIGTFNWSNPAASGYVSSFVLKVTQDGTGSRTITWPSSVDWASATAPTLSTGAADVDVFVFFTIDGGTIYYGFTAGQDMS